MEPKRKTQVDIDQQLDIMSTSGVAPKAPPLSANALRNLIEAAIARGYLEESEHAEHDHPERNLSIDDVVYGLKRRDWALAAESNYDREHHNWEYLIRTKDIEGNELEIKIAAYPDYKRIRIITKW
jgi:hypothetical protein